MCEDGRLRRPAVDAEAYIRTERCAEAFAKRNLHIQIT